MEKPVTDGDGTSNGGEKKAKSKKRANESGDANGSAKKKKVASTSKHPLRQAGMKPGEGCFLCKSKDHIAKNCPSKSAADRHKVRNEPIHQLIITSLLVTFFLTIYFFSRCVLAAERGATL